LGREVVSVIVDDTSVWLSCFVGDPFLHSLFDPSCLCFLEGLNGEGCWRVNRKDLGCNIVTFVVPGATANGLLLLLDSNSGLGFLLNGLFGYDKRFALESKTG
jgi:hypothetical protein